MGTGASAALGLLLIAGGGARAAAPGGALGPAAMDSYAQTLVVTLKSEADAQQAHLALLPLYHDFRAAFSTRMDDCTVNDLRAAEVMTRFGQKGTFYLNDPASWYQDSPDTGIVTPADPGEVIPKRLLANGSSIGGHTLTHEMLPALSKNAAFREIMGIRATLESRTGTPVNAFVYPFVDYLSAVRGGIDRADLDEMIRRSGYYQLAEHRYNSGWDSGFQDAVFVTLDNQSGGGRFVESAIDAPRCEADRPLFLVSMHAWVSVWGAPGFDRLAAIYERWSCRGDLWLCNQNQYAAYRYQSLHSRLATFVEGRTLRAILTRPSPLDLNDWTPLTLRIEGVGRDEVESVRCNSADVQVAPGAPSYAFDLFHDRDQGPVEAYSQTGAQAAGSRNGTETVEGLAASLERREGRLALALHNTADRALRDLRIVFRLPLRWQEGVVRRDAGPLAAGATVSVEVPLVERVSTGDYSDGPEYDVAQVDFVGARRARLYAWCRSASAEPPTYFARSGFWFLGPLPGDKSNFDPVSFAAPFLEGAAPKPEYSVPWAGTVAWRVLASDRVALLDPDIIPTTARPNTPKNYPFDAEVYTPHGNAHYLLYGRVVAPADTSVRAVFVGDAVRGLSLNGHRIDGAVLNLKAGPNDLRILYAPTQRQSGSFLETNYGCYLRLVDPDGNRATNVRFERPPRP